jgi:hypothetical protein
MRGKVAELQGSQAVPSVLYGVCLICAPLPSTSARQPPYMTVASRLASTMPFLVLLPVNRSTRRALTTTRYAQRDVQLVNRSSTARCIKQSLCFSSSPRCSNQQGRQQGSATVTAATRRFRMVWLIPPSWSSQQPERAHMAPMQLDCVPATHNKQCLQAL